MTNETQTEELYDDELPSSDGEGAKEVEDKQHAGAAQQRGQLIIIATESPELSTPSPPLHLENVPKFDSLESRCSRQEENIFINNQYEMGLKKNSFIERQRQIIQDCQ